MPGDATKRKFLGGQLTSASQQPPLIEFTGFRARCLVELGPAGELLHILRPGVGNGELLHSQVPFEDRLTVGVINGPHQPLGDVVLVVLRVEEEATVRVSGSR